MGDETAVERARKLIAAVDDDAPTAALAWDALVSAAPHLLPALVAEVERQQKAIDFVVEMLVELGGVAEGMALTGPQLVLLLDDLKAHVYEKRAEVERLTGERGEPRSITDYGHVTAPDGTVFVIRRDPDLSSGELGERP